MTNKPKFFNTALQRHSEKKGFAGEGVNKIILAAGGTGGHIFPAIAVYQRLKKTAADIEVVFLISERSTERMILEKYKCPYRILSVKPLPSEFSFQKIAGFIVCFLKSMKESLRIFLEYKPDMVVGFGCYVSAPVLLAAFLRGKKIILHEQNVLPGRTNLFFKKFAESVFLSFEETKKFFPQKAVFITGNPLRENLKVLPKNEAAALFGFKEGDFNILIMGGSQGSKIFNEVIPQAFAFMNEDKRRKISVFHMTGGKTAILQAFYDKSRIKAKVLDFLENIGAGFSACDLAVTRAGALTLSELSFFGLPAVLVPYVYDRGAQLENAKYYGQKKAGFVLEEKDFTAQNLKDLIEKMMDEPRLLESMKKNMLLLRKSSAAEEFSDIIIKKLKNKD